MRFVDNDCVVILQQRIMVYLGQQDAVGHQFDTGVGRYFVIETYFVARLATHDDDLMLFDSLSQLFAPCHHRQVGGIFNFGELLHTRQTALCRKR